MTTETRFELIRELKGQLGQLDKKLDTCQRAFCWALAIWNRDSNAGNYFSPFRAKTSAWSARIDALTTMYSMYSKELIKLYKWEY